MLFNRKHKHFCPCCTIIGPGIDFYGRDTKENELLEKKIKEYMKTPEGKKLRKEGKEFWKKFKKSLEENE